MFKEENNKMRLEGIKKIAIRNNCYIEVGLHIISDSMEPLIRKGSYINVSVGAYKIKRGDVIVYSGVDRSYCCHRVIAIQGDFCITKGDNNKLCDSMKVSIKSIVGVVLFDNLRLKIMNLYYSFLAICYLFYGPIILYLKRNIYVYK